MCGIAAIYNRSNLASVNLRRANSIATHRGPDDEGYLLWQLNAPLNVYSGDDTARSTLDVFQFTSLPDGLSDWLIGLGHRRLSIIDLTPTGHQPMMLPDRGLAITYNGEIYNYIELREELTKLGHQFKTSSDTEVILHAWSAWGKEALHRFNGMFAFVLLDAQLQKLYAVRDRFGVKPLYYHDANGYLAVASEVKQLRELPEYRFKLNEQCAFDYLRHGWVDHAEETFDAGIYQLPGGQLLELDIGTGAVTKRVWYELHPSVWRGTEQEACERFLELLSDSVRIRLRSDVPIGSALSGGLDSSTIVCLIRDIFSKTGIEMHPLKTITSCNEDKRFDEWDFASEVVKEVRAQPYRVFPNFEKLVDDLDRMLWHMDYPFGSTSQFSQWCVFECAREQGLSVMIDGQGADELLAGYGGNDMALYTGLLGRWKLGALVAETASYKRAHGRWPTGFLLGALHGNFPLLASFFPQRLRPLEQDKTLPVWLKPQDFRSSYKISLSLRYNLLNQVIFSPLPSLLRYEDRNSMAFSVESRVPFMDYRLVEFTLGLPETFIYHAGQRKYILRKAFKGVVPDNILERKDKMGFVSAEARWIREEGKDWFKNLSLEFSREMQDFIEFNKFAVYVNEVQMGLGAFNFDIWRVICLGMWLRQRSAKFFPH